MEKKERSNERARERKKEEKKKKEKKKERKGDRETYRQIEREGGIWGSEQLSDIKTARKRKGESLFTSQLRKIDAFVSTWQRLPGTVHCNGKQ